MHGLDNITVVFIVLTVVFFMLFGIAILVVIDHKAKIPESFHSDPFSIAGMRRDHPVVSFLTTVILGSIIFALMAELVVTLGERAGLFSRKGKPEVAIVAKLKEQRFTEKMRHFHNEPAEDFLSKGKKSVCFYCHGDFPHSKEPMIRTLLNMHTQFVGCMTCHNDPRKVDEKSLSFAWLNFSGNKVAGPHFGTSIDKKTGNLVQTDDYYSKIVATSTVGANSSLLEMTEENPDVKQFLDVKDKLSDADRHAVKKSFHKLVSPKGRFCTRCHTQDKGYLPFKDLGFSEQRVTDLTNLNIVGIVKKYRKFYMPNLLKADKKLPDVDSLLGTPSNGKPGKGTEVQKPKDASGWWR